MQGPAKIGPPVLPCYMKKGWKKNSYKELCKNKIQREEKNTETLKIQT